MASAAQLIAHVRVQGVPQFQQNMKKVDDAFVRAGKSAQRAGKLVSDFISPLQAAGRLAAGAAAGIGATVLGIGVAASKTATDFESLKMGLAAILGSTEAANAEFIRLRDLAKLPGLGFEEVAGGIAQLVAATQDLPLSERAVRTFGNALASVGKGKAELDRVFLAVSQIAGTGTLQGDELRQLQETLPQTRRLLMEAFGTADTNALREAGVTSRMAIESILTGLEKIPPVTGGARNAFENFADAVKIGLAAAGESINRAFIPQLDKVSSFVTWLADSGRVDKITQSFLRLFGIGQGGEGEGLTRAMSFVTAFLENLPSALEPVKAFFGGLQKSAVRFAITVIDGLSGIVQTMGEILTKATPIIDVLSKIAQILGGGTFGVRTYGKKELDALDRLKQGLQGSTLEDVLNSGQSAFSGFLRGVSTRAGEIFSDFQNRTPSAVPSLESVAQASHLSPYQSEMLSAADETERNTRRSAIAAERALDINRNIFGGGRLGAMGVTPAEFSAYRNGKGKITIEVKNARNMEAMIQEIAEQVTTQYDRTMRLRR